MSKLGDNLMLVRKHFKLSRQEVAKHLNVAYTTYTGYENGAREPNIATLIQLADLFEVTVDYLIGRNEEVNKPVAHIIQQRKIEADLDNVIREVTEEFLQQYKDEIKDKVFIRMEG